jgi:hypothetical protein
MTRHLLKLAIASAILVPALATAPANAQATRTWVSGVGDDVNPCSRTAPCKTFAGAISKTAAGGKINCLDPGGFGAVTITKSIEIDCLQFPGGILNAGTNGVNVSTTAGIKVVLRGIEIAGAGTGISGINVTIPSDLTVDKCFIIGQTQNGVNVNVAAAGVVNVIVLDTVITQTNKGIAFFQSGGASLLGHIRNVSIHKVASNAISLDAANTFVTVSNSHLSGNATGAAAGASGSVLNIVKSVMSFNSVAGLSGVAGSTVRMTDNLIVNNTTSTSVAGTFQSGGDNKLDTAGTAPGGMVNQ